MDNLPEGFVPVEITDFYIIQKDKTWLWKDNLIFILQAQDDTFEQYTTEGYNTEKIFHPDMDPKDKKPMYVYSNGRGYAKGSLIADFCDAGKCWVNKKDKFVKQLTAKEIKKHIVGKIDF